VTPQLSIVVPVYHEAENILRFLAEVDAHVKSRHETLVVYDYPDDPTYAVVDEFVTTGGRDDVRLVRNTVQSGRGVLNALKTGFAEARGEAVVVTMADLSDDLRDVDRMVELHKAGAKVVCASRYMRGGRQIGGPLLKRTMSRAAGVSLNLLRRVPTHDISNNFRLYDTQMLRSMTIESDAGFEVAMEITLKAWKAGLAIRETPTTWRDRTAGESNFKLWKWLPSYLRWYAYAFRPRRWQPGGSSAG
jgi:dolichol-phosphate mannosyltransferase